MEPSFNALPFLAGVKESTTGARGIVRVYMAIMTDWWKTR